ncbi:hypothetical protein H101_06066 [Trichophyton interdigitale H6]|nr:hypothetical protein H101_06066 [Trichophyton interdigitale H6]
MVEGCSGLRDVWHAAPSALAASSSSPGTWSWREDGHEAGPALRYGVQRRPMGVEICLYGCQNNNNNNNNNNNPDQDQEKKARVQTECLGRWTLYRARSLIRLYLIRAEIRACFDPAKGDHHDAASSSYMTIPIMAALAGSHQAISAFS